jgi:hypothetical protein
MPGVDASRKSGFSAASILRRRHTFQIPKQVPATGRLTYTQMIGVDHF